MGAHWIEGRELWWVWWVWNRLFSNSQGMFKRISDWLEENQILADEQSGFRPRRNTIEHILTLTTVIECRFFSYLCYAALLMKLSHYARIMVQLCSNNGPIMLFTYSVPFNIKWLKIHVLKILMLEWTDTPANISVHCTATLQQIQHSVEVTSPVGVQMTPSGSLWRLLYIFT